MQSILDFYPPYLKKALEIFVSEMRVPSNIYIILCKSNFINCRSQWPRGLRRRSSAARLLRLWIRIPPGAWMFVCCECYVLSGRGLCDGLITRPEGFCRLWRFEKTVRKQVKINRSKRWATPEATIPLAKN